ncbi:receptor-type tyrosine-protein phosphatase eta-like isoform X2 [Brienomyrus brachyistius]|uniref:receptor-type tyrosine-protein phosphatase eta-like isoform X2 n=1 Tax=Brienomyrus brachyistius TaxID=42636 RepID=UPI0020B26B16|nr:receptor-type tyrosine-protein phosphatase eta-like isoform X2 [Brienomyrus brachyistius]
MLFSSLTPSLARTGPDVIRNLTIIAISTTSVSLSWAPPVGNAAFYSVLWNDSSTQQNTTSLNTSITISDLTAGTQYTFRVTAMAGDNQTAGAPMSVSHFTRPDIIRNLTVTVISPTSVSLSWAPPVGNAAFYSVLWNASSTQQNTTSLNTSITISNLTAGTQYTFSVTAIAGDNQTAGAPISLSQYTRPDVIRNLNVTVISPTSVSLSWAPPGGNAAFYSVLWNASSTQQNTTSLKTSITITNLTAGTQYTFSVTGIAGDNQTAGASTSVSQYTKPDVIRNLNVTVTSPKSVSLSWAPPVGNAAFYSVLWNDSSTQQNTTSLNTSITISNLTAGTQYTFSVTAIAGDNKTAGAPISLSQYTRPDVIRNLTVTVISPTSVSLSWAPPVGNAAFYSVLWNASSTQQNTTSHNTSITISNLTAGTQYTFSVTAIAGDNQTAGAPIRLVVCLRPDVIRSLTVTVISPTSVSLSWTPPVGNVAFYSVLWNDSSTQQNTTSLNTSITISYLTAGTQYTFSVTAIARDNQTAGAPISLSQYTRPDVIRNLTIIAISPTSVSLSWAPPVGNAAFYNVLWNDSSTQQNTTSLNTSITISNLTAGTQYTFSVTAIAGDNQTAGAPISLSQYTNLTKPICSVSNGGTNNSINVNWTAPVGHVERYVVNLTSQYNETSMNSTCCSQSYTGLVAGTWYNATVAAISGPISAVSDPCSTATYPNEPGTIIITNKNVSSINLTWSPAVPQARQFSYIVSYASSALYTITVSTNSATLSSLLSGTAYNISVVTVGPLDLTSKPVWKYLVTTLPESVQGLQVFNTSTTAITLNWSRPVHYNGYQYMVMKNGTIIKNVSNMILNVDGLSPGTCYSFSVITLAADGTGSVGVNVIGYTDAAPPKDFACTGPNGADAYINISWQKPAGNYKGYQITVNGVNVNVSASDTSHVWHDLAYSMTYTVTIMTVGPGKNSQKLPISCTTGVTAPPMINVNPSALSPSQSSYNMFVLNLQSTIFNNSNGNITHVGVLVAIEGSGNTNDKQYLSETCDAWNANNQVGAYLAVVTKLQGGTRQASQADQISITVGDNTQWNAYQNAALQPTKSYSYSIAAFTSLITDNNNIVNIAQSFFSLSGPFFVTLPQNPAVIGGAVGGVFAVLIILIIAVIIGVLFWRRKQPRREVTEIPIQSMRYILQLRVKKYK